MFFLCIGPEHIVLVDGGNPMVYRIDEYGDVLLHFDCRRDMKQPSAIAMSGKDYLVCDYLVIIIGILLRGFCTMKCLNSIFFNIKIFL